MKNGGPMNTSMRGSPSRLGASVDVRRQFGILFVLILFCFDLSAQTVANSRTLRPDDLFQLRRIEAIAWSPDGRYATIEISKPSRWLGSVPTNDLALLDVKTQSIRPLSPRSAAYLGFFNAVWSPDSKRAAFLSVDRNAAVRVWVWTAGSPAAAVVSNLEARIDPNDPPLAWIDGARLAVMAWEAGAERSGQLYLRVLRGRNVATEWKRAFEGMAPTVSVLESGSSAPAPVVPGVELLTVDVRSGTRKRLARGRLHSLSVHPDGCCVSFLVEQPGLPGQPVGSYFERVDRAGDVEAGYAAVNLGTERHVVEAYTGNEIPNPPAASASKRQPRPDLPPPPRADARLLSVAPTRDAVLYLANGSDGSHLWLSGGAGRPLTASARIWQANEWMREIKLGRAESVAYTAADGTPLTAWLLLPPNHVPGSRVPVVTFVYPGSVYGLALPSIFSAFQAHFEHPQLFAALGYAVLLPSMPELKDPSQSHALPPLLNGVIPAIDAAIARGVADPDRIAVVGQSDGGFAVLGLITQTNRFRSAIASASSSNLVSLYGTFYGQYRHGDSGRPEAAQVLRMLQLEKGSMGLGGPPWAEPDRYRENSAILRAHKVETPLLLIHGDLDFVPIQQAEEFFTALFRQDKRARLLRYAGEGHTIADRENVLDLWRRMEMWLTETMSPRNGNR
jgi:dienelactone hydrolase